MKKTKNILKLVSTFALASLPIIISSCSQIIQNKPSITNKNLFYNLEVFSKKVPSEVNSLFLLNNLEVEINDEFLDNDNLEIYDIEFSDYYGWIKFKIKDTKNNLFSEELKIENMNSKKIEFDKNSVPIDLSRKESEFLLSITSSIIFTTKNSSENSKVYNGTGRFIDFYKTENEKYPKRWYFLTNSHVANISNVLKDNIDKVFLGNVNYQDYKEKNITEVLDQKVIFSGENFLNVSGIEINPSIKEDVPTIVDLSIIEINFKSEEEAKIATNNIYNQLQNNYFKKSFSSYKIHENEIKNEKLHSLAFFVNYSNVGNSVYDNIKNSLNFSFNSNNNKTLDSRFFENELLFLKNKSYFTDMTISFPEDFLNFDNNKYKTFGLAYVGQFLQFDLGSSGSGIYEKTENNMTLSTLHFGSYKDLNSNLSIALRTKGVKIDIFNNKNGYNFINYDIFSKDNTIMKNSYPYQTKSYFTEIRKKYGENYKTYLFENINER